MFADRAPRRSTLRYRIAAPLIGGLTVLGVLGAPTPAIARPAAESPDQKVTRVSKQADKLAASLLKRMSELEQLDDEIAVQERNAQHTETRIAKLRGALRGRAVSLYRQAGTAALNEDPDLATLLDQMRARYFADRVSSSDRTAINELRDASQTLQAERQRLASMRKRADAQRKELVKQNAQIQRELVAAKDDKKKADAAKAAQAQVARRGTKSSGPATIFGPAPTFNGLRCPIAGPISFRNDWGDPRSGGRSHAGNDLFSPQGTPNVAVRAGSVFRQNESVGGISAYLMADDGNTYYYTHLSGYAGSEGPVAAGQVIGYTGGTGNANGVMHTHFEIRIGGPNGQKVNPYPTLSRIC